MTDQQHESYGLISFSWVQSTGRPLFGSSIKHNSMIRVEVREATLRRELSNDWTMTGPLLLVGMMSPNQFAELITHPNRGAGTPLTLEYVAGDEKPKREDPPFIEKRQEFTRELSDHLRDVLHELAELRDEAKTVKARRKVEHVMMQVRNNIPYIEEQFSRQMDKTVTEAKAEVEAFMSQRLKDAGVAALAADVGLPALPESSVEPD